METALKAWPTICRADISSQFNNQERDMHQLIYLVGLIVVILAILSFFGLR
jgi:hypothetical protein